jgi:cytochrome c5
MTTKHPKVLQIWGELAPKFLPFADAASEDLPLSRLLRLSLFQVSVGMALVLLVGTLVLAGCGDGGADRAARLRAAGPDPDVTALLRVADVGEGERLFRTCAACHAIRKGAPDASEIGDRAAAIHEGVRRLKPGDALLIAGKGHETGQIVKGVTIPFSDFDVARAALKEVGGTHG